jgi:hypothetical protein
MGCPTAFSSIFAAISPWRLPSHGLVWVDRHLGGPVSAKRSGPPMDSTTCNQFCSYLEGALSWSKDRCLGTRLFETATPGCRLAALPSGATSRRDSCVWHRGIYVSFD